MCDDQRHLALNIDELLPNMCDNHQQLSNILGRLPELLGYIIVIGRGVGSQSYRFLYNRDRI